MINSDLSLVNRIRVHVVLQVQNRLILHWIVPLLAYLAYRSFYLQALFQGINVVQHALVFSGENQFISHCPVVSGFRAHSSELGDCLSRGRGSWEGAIPHT